MIFSKNSFKTLFHYQEDLSIHGLVGGSGSSDFFGKCPKIPVWLTHSILLFARCQTASGQLSLLICFIPASPFLSCQEGVNNGLLSVGLKNYLSVHSLQHVHVFQPLLSTMYTALYPGQFALSELPEEAWNRVRQRSVNFPDKLDR